METFYIFGSAEVTKLFENKSVQGCMAEAMQRLDEMLREVNPCAELNTRMHRSIKLNGVHE
jgi:hypothetical protein